MKKKIPFFCENLPRKSRSKLRKIYKFAIRSFVNFHPGTRVIKLLKHFLRVIHTILETLGLNSLRPKDVEKQMKM